MKYKCYECGTEMDLVADVLVCPECGHSVDLKDYSTDAEDYEEFYWGVIGKPVAEFNENEDFSEDLYEDIYED